MADRLTRELPGAGTVHALFSDAGDGDLAVAQGSDPLSAAGLEARRAALCPLRWTWLEQVHGATVLRIESPGERAGEQADAAVTDRAAVALAVHTADCAAVLMWSPSRSGGVVVGAAHAGWRGLGAGVLGATVEAMADLGARDVSWCLGPCISPAAYEFGEDALEDLARRYGPAVRGRTDEGGPALDLRAAVRCALAEAGVTDPPQGPAPACTARSGRHFSWRSRQDTARQAAVIWWEEPT